MLELFMLLSLVLGHYSDLVIVSALLVINAVLGFAQESRGAGVMETLRVTSPHVFTPPRSTPSPRRKFTSLAEDQSVGALDHERPESGPAVRDPVEELSVGGFVFRQQRA